MKQIHKRTKGWCYGCDANIVAGNCKCSVCGVRYFVNRIKKISKNKILEFFDKDKI